MDRGYYSVETVTVSISVFIAAFYHSISLVVILGFSSCWH